MRTKLVLAILLGLGATSWTVRAATAEDVAQGFRQAIVTYCALSVAYDMPLTQWPSENLAGLSVTTNQRARQFMQAAPEDTVWDVSPGTGAIFLLQTPSGDCRVMGYGPPSKPVFDATMAAMTDPPYALQTIPSPAGTNSDGDDRWLTVQINDKKLIVELNGAPAGSASNASPFSTISGFVSKDTASQTSPASP